jgi:hypothetical protein
MMIMMPALIHVMVPVTGGWLMMLHGAMIVPCMGGMLMLHL